MTIRDTIMWPAKHTTVDVATPDELIFWANRFHVSASVLKKVVQLVGPRFTDVARFIHGLHTA